MKQSTLRHHISLLSQSDFAEWRDKARELLAHNMHPDAVTWEVVDKHGISYDLFAGADVEALPKGHNISVKVPKDLLALLKTALLHDAPDRFFLAYRLLYNSQKQPGLRRNPVDSDVRKLNDYAKSVRRDIHKMHAFVRFRKTGETDAGREQFVAWFEPEHYIVDAVAAFFRNRFNGMDWLIVTPLRSIAWDGENISYGPGGAKSDVAQQDQLEDEWRAYYRSIFNPARVKVAAMKSEMPMKYWKNLPEAELITPLLKQATRRVDGMLQQDNIVPNGSPKQEPQRPQFSSLEQLYEAMSYDSNLPRENFAQDIVKGEGPLNPEIMLLGEQPGDEEDRQGRPFIGPAGQLLSRALEQAGLERDKIFLTNAVKRFKYTPRGPRRIHQTPNASDINAYRAWLQQEIALVNPDMIIALGATAARAMIGKSVTISRTRSTIMPWNDNRQLLVTVHPSYLLRLPDAEGRKIEHEKFVRDLIIAREAKAIPA